MAIRRGKSFCFTLNNYTEEEYERVEAGLRASAEYWILGKEVASTGTPHLQGYARFCRRYDFNQLKDILSSRIHVEVARGSPKQNRAYCSKDGEFREGGTLPKGGEERKNRNQLADEFRDAIRRGPAGVDKFAEENPGSWYFSGYSLLRNAQLIIKPIMRPEISVQWIYGPPGVGKSRSAHEQLPEAYIKEPRTKWWNGYLYEKEVIIDDFAPGGIDINHLLRWFDRYKCMVETKGGMVALVATVFIVTSNFSPEDCFRDKEGVMNVQTDALKRRINIIKMD